MVVVLGQRTRRKAARGWHCSGRPPLTSRRLHPAVYLLYACTVGPLLALVCLLRYINAEFIIITAVAAELSARGQALHLDLQCGV